MHVCACGKSMVPVRVGTGAEYCTHCDRPCHIRFCGACRAPLLHLRQRTEDRIMTSDVTCGTCHTTRVYKRIQTTVPGTTAVELGICDCDFPSCQRDGCGKTLRHTSSTATRCPHCNGLLWSQVG